MTIATSQTYGPFSVDQFIIGESPIVTGNGVTDGSVTKYQLLKLTDTGVTPTLGNITDGGKLVIAALDPRRRGSIEDLHAWVESAGEIMIGEIDQPFHPVVRFG